MNRLSRTLPHVMLLAALAACSEAPTSVPGPEVAPTVSLAEHLRIALEAMPETPAVAPITSFSVVVDPYDPDTETHDFNDLPYDCSYNATIPNPYEGLNFLTTPYLAACSSPNGTMAVVPADLSHAGSQFELRFQLPEAASAVSIESFSVASYYGVPTLNAYDASGALVGTSTDATEYAWVTLAVSGDIHQVGLFMPQGYNYLDNLRITYVRDPQTKDDCKDGGWVKYGFKNQGQCVRFVETGKDSR